MSPGPRCSRSTSRSGASSGGDEDRPPSTSASDSEDLPPPPYLSPEVVNNISKGSLELPYRSSDYSTVCLHYSMSRRKLSYLIGARFVDPDPH